MLLPKYSVGVECKERKNNIKRKCCFALVLEVINLKMLRLLSTVNHLSDYTVCGSLPFATLCVLERRGAECFCFVLICAVTDPQVTVFVRLLFYVMQLYCYKKKKIIVSKLQYLMDIFYFWFLQKKKQWHDGVIQPKK